MVSELSRERDRLTPLLFGPSVPLLGQDEKLDRERLLECLAIYGYNIVMGKIDDESSESGSSLCIERKDYVELFRTIAASDRDKFQFNEADEDYFYYDELIVNCRPNVHFLVDNIGIEMGICVPNGGPFRYKSEIWERDDSIYIDYLSLDELRDLILNLDEMLNKATMSVLDSGIQNIVPEQIREHFLDWQFTQAQCHFLGINSWEFGHEFSLKCTPAHDFQYAYTSDSIVNWFTMSELNESVTKAYQIMKDLAVILPGNVMFSCEDCDDFGSEFMAIDPTSLELRKMRALVEIKCNEQHAGMVATDEIYSNTMELYDISDMTIDQFKDLCDAAAHDVMEYYSKVADLIGDWVKKVGFRLRPEGLAVCFCNPDKNITRNCFLTIPYGADCAFLEDMELFSLISADLVALVKNPNISLRVVPRKSEWCRSLSIISEPGA